MFAEYCVDTGWWKKERSHLLWIWLRQKPHIEFKSIRYSLRLIRSVGVVATPPWVSSAAVGSNPAQINKGFFFSTDRPLETLCTLFGFAYSVPFAWRRGRRISIHVVASISFSLRSARAHPFLPQNLIEQSERYATPNPLRYVYIYSNSKRLSLSRNGG